jgi:hypothetical protein
MIFHNIQAREVRTRQLVEDYFQRDRCGNNFVAGREYRPPRMLTDATKEPDVYQLMTRAAPRRHVIGSNRSSYAKYKEASRG